MKISVCLLALLFLLPFCVYAQEPELPGEIQQILEEPGITAEEFRTMDLSTLIHRWTEPIRTQLKMPLRLLAQVVGAVLFSAAALALAPQKEWTAVLETISVLGVFALTLSPAMKLAVQAGECILEGRNYLVSFVPVFSGVLVSCGQPGQAAVYSGMFLTMAAFSAQLIATIAMPLLQVYIALNTASGICGVDGLSDACSLLSKSVKWILGFLSMLFSAVLALQSALAQTADNLALRTGRFLVSSGLPIVGGLASDAMGSVLSALKVVKGSLGFAAVAMLAITFLPMILQCLGCFAAYSLGGAAAKAFGLGRAGKVLEGMGQAVGLCLSFLVFFFILVVLSTALMILMGGG